MYVHARYIYVTLCVFFYYEMMSNKSKLDELKLSLLL